LCSIETQLPHKKWHRPRPIFGPCLLWPNGWMDQDATWYGSRTRPRPHYIRRGPIPRERGTTAPLFSAHVYCGHGRPSQLLLSSCCTADGRQLLYFTTGRPFPLKIVPSHELQSWSHHTPIIHGSSGPPEFLTRTASRSVQPFLHGSLL